MELRKKYTPEDPEWDNYKDWVRNHPVLARIIDNVVLYMVVVFMYILIPLAVIYNVLKLFGI